jgi:DNA-binding MarR family transcriptional regulator
MIDARIGEMAARLHSNSVRLLRLARRDDEDAAIGGSRLSALTFIALAGPVSLAEIAAAEQVRCPTMSRLVDSLVADGLVTRDAHPDDRRRVRIAATPEGLRLLEEGRSGRMSALAGRLARLAESERRALYRGVELMERMLRSQP